MAKRSNKTEHVMKLITKDDEMPDEVGVDVDDNEAVDVDASVTEHQKEINYKTKLKIEIEPEIEFKDALSKANVQANPEAQSSELEAASEQPLTQEVEDAIRQEEREKAFAEAKEVVKEEVKEEALEEAMAIAREEARKEEERKTRRILVESALLDNHDHLINLAEILTKELLPSVMEKMDACTCPMCTTNILALALNNLQPRYVTSDEGKQYTQLDVYKKQYELDVMAALTKACVKVKSTPRHEVE